MSLYSVEIKNILRSSVLTLFRATPTDSNQVIESQNNLESIIGDEFQRSCLHVLSLFRAHTPFVFEKSVASYTITVLSRRCRGDCE